MSWILGWLSLACFFCRIHAIPSYTLLTKWGEISNNTKPEEICFKALIEAFLSCFNRNIFYGGQQDGLLGIAVKKLMTWVYPLERTHMVERELTLKSLLLRKFSSWA